MLGSFRAVVPPAAVPQALKESGRMTGDEMTVLVDCFLEQLQNACMRVTFRNRVQHVGVVRKYIKQHPRLCSCFQEGQVFQEQNEFFRLSGLQQLPGQFVDLTDIRRSRRRGECLRALPLE